MFEHFRQENAQKNPVNPVNPVHIFLLKIESIPLNLKSAQSKITMLSTHLLIRSLT